MRQLRIVVFQEKWKFPISRAFCNLLRSNRVICIRQLNVKACHHIGGSLISRIGKTNIIS